MSASSISRLQLHFLSAGIQQSESGTQARETCANNHCVYLLHDGMLHAKSQS